MRLGLEPTLFWALRMKRRTQSSLFAVFTLPHPTPTRKVDDHSLDKQRWSELGSNLDPSTARSKTLTVRLRHLSYVSYGKELDV